MLRIVTSSSVSRAKSYYTTGFSREDYYSEGQNQEVIGAWGGRAAQMLGLSGKVDRQAFMDLCDNLHPQTGEPLTVRTKSSRRVGYDFNFSVTKSVSLLQAITGDRRIVEAFRAAVHETMLDLEREVQTRVRGQGQDADRLTGNLVWAEFIHFTARPEQAIADPHLHAHCFVFNATFDAVEQRWKAGQFAGLKMDAPFFEALFQNRLAQKLIDLGYPIVRKDKAFEIAGIPERVLKQFSRRTAHINKVIAERGVEDPKEKDAIGAATRQAKLKDMPLETLRRQWIQALDPQVHQTIQTMYGASLQRSRGQGEQTKEADCGPERGRAGGWEGAGPSEHGGRHGANAAADRDPRLFAQSEGALERQALDFAILHSFERASVVDERRLLETAIRFGVGAMNLEVLQRLVRERVDLLRKDYAGRTYLTTPQVVAEERAMLEWVQNGQGTQGPLVLGHVVQDQRLTDEQRAAVRHVLESRDRVTGIHGRSGTGKTTAIKEAIGAMEAHGHRVFVFAPTAEAARQILRRDFARAETVAQLLNSEPLQREATGAVWWIDEAGLLSARDMSRLAKLAQGLGARVVMSGDVNQHRAVERGDALRILEKHAGLAMATVAQIQRQQGVYREAVEDLSNGRMVEAFEKLDQMGAIREMDSDLRYQALAQEYLKARQEGASALVVSPTHSEIRKVTELVRQGLQAQGHLADERPFESLRRVDLTQAQRADIRSYREGWIVEMIHPAKGHRAGERLTVLAIGPEGLDVVDREGRTSRLSVREQAKAFQVYAPEPIALAAGDRIRITKNGKTLDHRHRVHNGSLHTVQGFDDAGNLVLDGGQVLARDYAHWTYGYATTSHAAQGKTVDRVLVAESSESFVAASRQQFYVSVSRGREAVIVFTDDREELLEAVHASSQRLAALDLGTFEHSRETSEREANKEEEPEAGGPPTAADFAETAIEPEDRWHERPADEQTDRREAAREQLGQIPLPLDALANQLREVAQRKRERERATRGIELVR